MATEGVDGLTPEEEERILGLMDDGVQASIATMFMGRERDDSITLDHLTEMMAELQVAWDPEALARMVPEERHDSLTLHETKLVIGRFVDMAQRSSAEQAKADNAVTVTQSAATVVHLDTLAYLSHLLPCSNSEDGVTYKWNRPQINVRPKTALMASVAGMMLLVAVVLVIVVVVLGHNAISAQAQESQEQFAAATDAIFRRLTDVGARGLLADTLRQAAESFASVVDGMLSTHEALIFDALHATGARLRDAVATEAQAAADAEQGHLRVRLETLGNLFGEGGAASSLEALLALWGTRDSIISLAGNPSQSGLVYAPTRYFARRGIDCSDAAMLASPCLAGASTTPTLGSTTLCGDQFVHATVQIPRLNVAVCAMLPVQTVQQRVVEKVAQLVTFANTGLDLDGGYELQVAVRYSPSDAPIAIGSRRDLAAACARVGTCQEIVTGPFTAALDAPNATTQITTEKLFGYEARQLMAAHTRVDIVAGAQLAVLYTVDYEHVSTGFRRAVGQGLYRGARNATTDVHVVLAVFDRLRRVTLLSDGAGTPLPAEKEYLTYALNQRDGFTVPASDSRNEFLAGYTSAPNAQIGVGVQLSNVGLGVATSAYFAAVADDANTQLPEGWEITVYRIETTGEASLLTKHRKTCHGLPCEQGHPALDEALRTHGSAFIRTTDYSGEEVHAWYTHDAGPPSVVVIAEISHEEWVGQPQRNELIEAVIVGLVALVVVQLVIFVLTQRIMDRIEHDYTRYKQRIEEEKAQFSDLVKDVMPPYIAERIMKGTRLIAETHQQLTFFFSDIVGSTETSKTLTNKQLVRMLGYTFMLEDDVAAHFGVHKIKTIGDAYFAVAGLEDATATPQTGHNHQVYRMVSFACVTQQLIGPKYTHYPERTECFRISSGGQDLGPMRMVRMRMGVHTGTAVAGVVDVGRAPHFDCFGPSVNLASRMESTSTAGRVQVSGPTAEILGKFDTDRLFEFDAPRRTLVKGYGTMTTFLVRSTNVPIPKSILEKLGIEHANQRQFFSESQMQAATPGGPTGPVGIPGAALPGSVNDGAATPGNPGRDASQPGTPARTVGSDASGDVRPKDKSEKKHKKDKHDKHDKRDKHDKKDKKEKKEKRVVEDEAPQAPAAQQPARRPVFIDEPAETTTLLPDTVPPPPPPPPPPAAPVEHHPSDVANFDVDIPEPPPAFDPTGFDLPPPPPPDM